jgi:hypothetical protein
MTDEETKAKKPQKGKNEKKKIKGKKKNVSPKPIRSLQS